MRGYVKKIKTKKRYVKIKKNRKKKKPEMIIFGFFVFFMILIQGTGVVLADNIYYFRSMSVENYRKFMVIVCPQIACVYDSGGITSLYSDVEKIFSFVFSCDFSSKKGILMSNSIISKLLYKKLNSYNVQDEGEKSYSDKPEEEYDMGGNDFQIDDSEVEEKSLSYDGISINNESFYKIDLEKLLNEPVKFNFQLNTSKVLIYHTHTTESYLTRNSETRKEGTYGDVVEVGRALSNKLKKSFGIQTIHNTTIHDYPDFNKAYTNSFNTVASILKADSSIRSIIDIHRDACGNNKKLAVSANIKGKKVAKIMFVVAAGSDKRPNPIWQENLKIVARLQKYLNDKYKGIVRPIHVCSYRYNQHIIPGSILIEFGGDGNTLEESLSSAEFVAEAIKNIFANIHKK